MQSATAQPAGITLIDAILRGDLAGYHLAHTDEQADLHRRQGQLAAARTAYARALALAEQEPERRYLAVRLAELAE